MIKFSFGYVEFEVLLRGHPSEDFQEAVDCSASRI